MKAITVQYNTKTNIITVKLTITLTLTLIILRQLHSIYKA